MEKKFKFKIYNKLSNKCFKVTRIDYMDEIIYYFDREKNDEDIISFDDAVLLMPTGIYDSSDREIFEGDIITYQESSFTYKKTAEIIFENGCFMTKQLLPKNLELKAQKENLIINDFKDLLCVSTSSNYKPIKIIGNVFTYKISKNIGKIKIEV